MLIKLLNTNAHPFNDHLFNNIITSNKILVVIDFSHINNLYHGEYVQTIKNIKLPKLDKLLLHISHEAPYLQYYNELIEHFNSQNVLTENILISDAGYDLDIQTVKHAFFPNFITMPKGFHGIKYQNIVERQKIYNSFARLPKKFRVLFTLLLLDNNLEQYGNISCGAIQGIESNSFGNILRDIDLKYLKYENKFPIVFDDKDINTFSSWEISENFRSKATQAKFHVALETSFEHTDSLNTFWNRKFITEKTMMGFAMYQIPLILSVPGSIDVLRYLGFDVFDDIVNHEYDLQQDPYKRIYMLIEELKRLCFFINDINLTNIEHRLINNFERINVSGNKYLQLWAKNINDWFDDKIQ